LDTRSPILGIRHPKIHSKNKKTTKQGCHKNGKN
jgi:hypothetical protein